jgi:sigma-54 dependent transcriptional regulator, acetoin dehydrogenase operon transcriptional activator AcoR
MANLYANAGVVGRHPASKLRQVRPEIARSWERSSRHKVSRDQRTLPHPDVEVDPTSELRRSAEPVLSELNEQLDGTSAAVLLSDAAGRLQQLWMQSADIRRVYGCVDATPGADAAERAIGTNAVGTALAHGRPTLVLGAEHFVPAFQQLRCAASAVRHPLTRRIIGTVGVAVLVPGWDEKLLQLVTKAARDVEQHILEQASLADRIVMETLKIRAAAHHRVVGASRTMMMASGPGLRLLQEVDQALLWEVASETIDSGRGQTVELSRSPELDPLTVACSPVDRDGRTIGAILDFGASEVKTGRRRLPSRTAVGDGMKPLTGRSAESRALLRRVDATVSASGPVLVRGEPGAGKAEVAKVVLGRRFPGLTPRTLSCAGLAVESLLSAIRSAQQPVILTHLETAKEDIALRLRDTLRDVGGPLTHIAATINTSRQVSADSAVTALTDALIDARIEVPPLRFRREDIVPMTEHFARCLGHRTRRFRPEATQILLRYSWPGNVRELRSVVADALSSTSGDVGPEHLPRDLCRMATRRPLTPLEQAEADAIIDALHACRNNKVRAAELLQISRSRLYRKISAYGLTGALLN